MAGVLIIIAGLLALGIGVGLGFLKVIPKMVVNVIAILALIGVAFQFWTLVGLPEVELFTTIASSALVSVIAIGFVLGTMISNLMG